MTEETGWGKIEIAPTAIASIATWTVLECYGVVGITSRRLRGGFFRRDNYRRGVEVKIDGGRIIINLYVVIEYGTRISEVAHNIMSNVKFSVEKVLGTPVAEVNVHVQGLRVSSEEVDR